MPTRMGGTPGVVLLSPRASPAARTLGSMAGLLVILFLATVVSGLVLWDIAYNCDPE